MLRADTVPSLSVFSAGIPHLPQLQTRDHLRVLGIYLVSTVAMTYPLVLSITQSVPGDVNGDAGWAVWMFWIVADAIRRGINPLFTNLIYYPTGVSLISQAFDLVDTLLFLPIYVAFGPVAEQNVAILFAFTLTGYGGFLLGRHVSGNAVAGFVCGFAFAFGPFHTIRLLGHLVWITVEWVPFMIYFVIRSLESRMWRHRLRAATFWVLASLTNWYFAIYLAIFLIGAVTWTMVTEPGRSDWRRPLMVGVTIAGMALIGVLPILIPIGYESLHGVSLQRPEVESVNFSDDLLDYIIPSPLHPWFGSLVPSLTSNMHGRSAIERTTYIGLTIAVLALAGIYRAWSAARFWVATALLFALLSLGPLLHINGTALPIRIGGQLIPLPFQLLWHVPIMQATHVPARFEFLVCLCADVLAALGLSRIFQRIQRLSGRLGVPISAFIALAAIAAEFLVVPIPMTPVVVPQFYQRLATSSDSRAIVEVPMLTYFGLYQFYQVFHGHSMVGGYLPRNPPDAFGDGSPAIVQLKYLSNDVVQQDPVRAGRAFLKSAGIGYVVLHKDLLDLTQLSQDRTFLTAVLGSRAIVEDSPVFLIYGINPNDLEDSSYVSIGSNWSQLGIDSSGARRWMYNDGNLLIHSTQKRRIRMMLSAASLVTPRHMNVIVHGETIGSAIIAVTSTDVTTIPFTVDPGETTVTLHTVEPPRRPIDLGLNDDIRYLSLLVGSVRIEDALNR